MIYKHISSSKTLKSIIKSFWMVDNEGDTTKFKEKIIPDGYPEMIFHYKDPYKANISGKWVLQNKYLIAGQITNHFFLENTGASGMIGIKFQPWAIKQLFDIDMSEIVNKVIQIPTELIQILKDVEQIVFSEKSFKEKTIQIEDWFLIFLKQNTYQESNYMRAVKLIITTKGELSIKEISEKAYVNERGLERYFKTYIGLSPKHYSRIIRFSNIFGLVQQKDFNWSDISFISGFYDQAHFIKNFKEFTGEEPSAYGFDDKNMANLFLKFPQKEKRSFR